MNKVTDELIEEVYQLALDRLKSSLPEGVTVDEVHRIVRRNGPDRSGIEVDPSIWGSVAASGWGSDNVRYGVAFLIDYTGAWSWHPPIPYNPYWPDLGGA